MSACFLFKHKTAYEMRISDWSSDVCSSDLVSPFITAIIGLMVERVLIRPLYNRDPLYSLLLTFGLAYVLQDSIRFIWGAQGLPLQTPAILNSPLSPTLFFLTGYRV